MNILMVTIGYPPEQIGGTEIYVAGLVDVLQERGHACAIAYVDEFVDESGPPHRVRHRSHNGTDVFAMEVNRVHYSPEFLVFDGKLRELLVLELLAVVARLRPDVVHIHPLRLGLESYLVEALTRASYPVVLTFHSSTTTCARGDLVFMGREVCDGQIRQHRCTACLMHSRGVPAPAARLLSAAPPGFYRRAHTALAAAPTLRKLRSFASLPLLVEEQSHAFARTGANVRALVAVCDWVKETAIRNGAPAEKVVSSRHGLRLAPEHLQLGHLGVTRFGYLGRIGPEKGIGVLLDALEQLPEECRFEFEFCSASFGRSALPRPERLLRERILAAARRDGRIRIVGAVDDDALSPTLARWDAIVVPSLWLESGPQVVYEAFAVATPVIGSRRGGIAELVRDGKTGFLFTPNDAAELTCLLERFAEDPSPLRAMRSAIPPVRTTEDVADDMESLYARVTGRLQTSAPQRSAN